MTALKFYSKPRRKRVGPEACLQMAVVQHLMLRAPKDIIWFHPANEGKRSAAEGAHLKRMGMLPGIADLVICRQGKPPCFLELKAKGEKQSDDQRAFERCCWDYGFAYAVADNIDAALGILEGWGVLPERRRAAA